MTHHEKTFGQAVAMATASISAGQLGVANREEIRKAILAFYDLLIDAESSIGSDDADM